jgi:hypothetical protein
MAEFLLLGPEQTYGFVATLKINSAASSRN